MIHDQWLLSPKRVLQAMLVYFWWMNLEETQGIKLASVWCHVFYFRREGARFRHEAGYFAPLGFILRAHLKEWLRAGFTPSRHRPGVRPGEGSVRQPGA